MRIDTELTERLADDTILDYLRWLNQPTQLRFNHTSMFGRYLRWGGADTFGGPGVLARWYERNLRMVHNCWRAVAEGDERLLLVVGSGHVRVLRHLLTETPMFCPISPLSYLQSNE